MIISTPGRICLFGEHQDYLGLPIIAMAISLRATIIGDKRTDNQIIIHKPDLGEITSEIPIRAGTSSSSAIAVSWIHYLSRMANEPPNWDQQKIGELAYKSEVKEFNEPGGMMDQYSTAMGNLIYLQSEPDISIEPLAPNLGTFVLGDSCEPKDTMGILSRCRDARLNIIDKLKTKNPTFNINKRSW